MRAGANRSRPYPATHKPIPGRTPDELETRRDPCIAVAPDGTPMRLGLLGWRPLADILRPSGHERLQRVLAETKAIRGTLRPCEAFRAVYGLLADEAAP